MKNLLPVDLIYEIVPRLPGKSIARFRCVSKLWCSILRRQDFIELFLTRSAKLLTRSSSAPPRLLLGVRKEGCEWSLYSMPLPQDPHEKRSNVVTADFHMNFSRNTRHDDYSCSYASGLIYFNKRCIPWTHEDLKHAICNPLTGQYVILPELTYYLGIRDYSYSYLGFDPFDYEFKVLFLKTCGLTPTDCHILTLGTGKLRWRKIQCPFKHQPLLNRICISGVLYYLAKHIGRRWIYMIVCFDVKSEKFKFIDAECCYDQLINYKGKLCGITLEYDRGGGFLFKLSMWVLKDVKKQKWLKYVYSFSAESEVLKLGSNLSVSGITATGDIVLTMQFLTSKPFYVCYLNPERKTLRIVEIQGLGANRDRLVCVNAFVDYVEDVSLKPQQRRHKSWRR